MMFFGASNEEGEDFFFFWIYVQRLTLCITECYGEFSLHIYHNISDTVCDWVDRNLDGRKCTVNIKESRSSERQLQAVLFNKTGGGATLGSVRIR